MSLIAVKTFVYSHKKVTLAQLCREFAKPEAWVTDWLEFWLAKGKIAKMIIGKGCAKSCASCKLPEIECYVPAE